MSKEKNWKARKKKEPSWLDDSKGFVAITFEMIDSTAFKELTGSGLKALILLMRKNKNSKPLERFKYQFSFTYPEGRKQGICNASFCRAIKQLHRLGFIDIVIKGGLRGVSKYPNYYRLSQRWKQFGTPAFQKIRDGYDISIHGEFDQHSK